MLNNMVAGSKPRQFQSIPFADLLPALVLLMTAKAQNPRVVQQAAWILDNSAQDFDKCREDALEAGAMAAALKVHQKELDGFTCKFYVLFTTGPRVKHR
jgi:hypothetical protein